MNAYLPLNQKYLVHHENRAGEPICPALFSVPTESDLADVVAGKFSVNI